MLGVGIPAASFYLNELFYYDTDAFLLNFGGRFALFLIWLGWVGVCLFLVFMRWRTFHSLGLAPLVVILASGLFHHNADLWRNHNYENFTRPDWRSRGNTRPPIQLARPPRRY